MKTKLYIITLVFAGLFMSCKDYLDVDSTSTMPSESIYTVYGSAKGAVDGILNSMGMDKSYRNRFIPWYGMNTDCEWYNSSTKGDGKADLCTYTTHESNDQMDASGKDHFAYAYQGIEKANLAIEGLRTYGDVENDADMAYLLGRALTYRAVYYADLLKAYGDVPARFIPVTSETTYLPKTSRDSIYIQLLADLEEAEEYVPWPTENTDLAATTEDINKAFVKGLRARLAMNAGGYSAYPDDLTGSAGYEVRKSTATELDSETMWKLAFDECESIIEHDGSYVNLDADFEDIFKRNCQDDLTAGLETLWEIPFRDGRGQLLYYYAVPHDMGDQYYSYANGGGGSNGPVPTMFYDYDVNDLRRDVSVVPYSWVYDKDLGYSQQVLSSSKIAKWYFGKYRYEWMSRIASSSDDGINKIYMRYAEVVLIAAESAAELGDYSSARKYLKKVRSRAFSDAAVVETYMNSIADGDLLTAIQDEYKFEFCGEMLRKECLIRWGLLDEKLAEAKSNMYDLRDRSGNYNTVPKTVYYTYDEDNETLICYGLNKGESDSEVMNQLEDLGYEHTTWINDGRSDSTEYKLTYDKIESLNLFSGEDVNQHQFWPIWQYDIVSSNGYLVNSFGYDTY